MKHQKTVKGQLTFEELYGRLPTPKKGGAMKAKKGRGSYKRSSKHTKGWSSNDHPFFCLFFWSINSSMKYSTFINKMYEAEVSPEKRTWGNIPKYSTGKLKVPFTQWLGLKGQGSKGYDGKFYGWSHRAVYGFKPGDTIKMGSIGNKYQYGDAVNKKYNSIADKDGYEKADAYISSIKFEPYKIKDEAEAKEHAIRFGKEIS